MPLTKRLRSSQSAIVRPSAASSTGDSLLGPNGSSSRRRKSSTVAREAASMALADMARPPLFGRDPGGVAFKCPRNQRADRFRAPEMAALLADRVDAGQ